MGYITQVSLTPQEIAGLNEIILPHLRVEAGAKAQLKKVLEWLDTLKFYKDWGGEGAEGLRDHIKQVILREIA